MTKTHKLNLGQKLKNVGRLTQIVNVYAKQGFWSVFDRAGIRAWLTPEQVNEAEESSRTQDVSQSEDFADIARRVRVAFEQLGPDPHIFRQIMPSRLTS